MHFQKSFMKNYLILILLILFQWGITGCQKSIESTDTPDPDPNPPRQKSCQVTEITNLQWSWLDEDSTHVSKLFYDSAGKLKYIINPTYDTLLYSYSSSQIILDVPQTIAAIGQIVPFASIFYLNAQGLATRSEGYTWGSIVDSTKYFYDGNGFLIRQEYDAASDDVNIDYSYENGNLKKAVLRGTSYYPDSIVFKSINLLVPAEAFHLLYWNKYNRETYYPWTGKQSRHLFEEIRYHFSWGTVAHRYQYINNSDGLPVTIRNTRFDDGIPKGTVTYFLKYRCK